MLPQHSSVIEQGGVGSMIRSTIFDWMLIELVLCSASAGNHSCSKVLIVVAFILRWQYPATILPIFRALTFFVLFVWDIYKLWREGLINVLLRAEHSTMPFSQYIKPPVVSALPTCSLCRGASVLKTEGTLSADTSINVEGSLTPLPVWLMNSTNGLLSQLSWLLSGRAVIYCSSLKFLEQFYAFLSWILNS